MREDEIYTKAGDQYCVRTRDVSELISDGPLLNQLCLAQLNIFFLVWWGWILKSECKVSFGQEPREENRLPLLGPSIINYLAAYAMC